MSHNGITPGTYVPTPETRGNRIDSMRSGVAAMAMSKRGRLLWHVLRRASRASDRNGVLGNAKGAAYSALLAFFPLLATTATILLRAQAQFISNAIYNFLSDALPPGTKDLVFILSQSREQPVFVPITGMLVSIWRVPAS